MTSGQPMSTAVLGPVPRMGKRVTILHDALGNDAPDEADNRRQVEEVGAALKRLGHEVRELPVGPDLAKLAATDRREIGTAFNLIEGLGGCFYIYTAAAQHLEWRGIPFTGAGGDHLLTLSNKLLLRRMLPPGVRMPKLFGDEAAGDRFIVKSVREHSSIGIDAKSVVARGEVEALIARRRARFGGDWFAESYVEGREFILAGIAAEDRPLLFPPSEIVFGDVPEGIPRILDYTSKWDKASQDYARTPRRALDARAEPALQARLMEEGRSLWRGLRLQGYARFDYRLAEDGALYLIDVNLNPCLSSDGGFMAGAATAGLSYDAAVAAILAAAHMGP